MHKDPRHNYDVSVTVSTARVPSFMVSVNVGPQEADEMDRPKLTFTDTAPTLTQECHHITIPVEEKIILIFKCCLFESDKRYRKRGC
jgi:hypothetical protein